MNSPTQQHLLVIGASSLVGRRLREIAPQFQGSVQFTGNTKLTPGDLKLDAYAPELFSPVSPIAAVIFCAPISRLNEALLQRLQKAGMKRLVVFSSTSILTKITSNDAAERLMLEQLKAGEELVRSFCAQSAISWTIFRPTMIYDEGRDKNVSQIMRVIRRFGFFPIAGKAQGLRRPVHAADLAKAALDVLKKEACTNKIYVLSGGEELTYKQMVERIYSGMGLAPLILPMPLLLWRLGFLAKSFFTPRSGVNFEMARRMNKHMNFEHTEASSDFGYSPRAFLPKFSASLPQA